jgi:hypothetical protein
MIRGKEAIAMTHTIFSERFFTPSEEAYATFEITPTVGQKRLFVMAIRGGQPTPAIAVYMPASRRPGRGSLVSPTWAKALPDGEGLVENPVGDQFRLRPVEGRVVSDAGGRLCEVTGRELRLLGRVARGPQGELLELLPVTVHAGGNPGGEDYIDGELEQQTKAPAAPPLSQTKKVVPRDAVSPQRPDAERLGFRRLFADPGLPRVLELGQFRDALTSQLAHPERLRDLHRLACYVQVYEPLTQQRTDEFLEAIQRERQKSIFIKPLTEESIAILGLKEFLARHPRPPHNRSRESGYVRPFECFYSLQVSSDPTAEGATSQQANASSEGASRVPGSPSFPQTKPSSLRHNIPERFQTPWEFQFSRDEVLYDMNVGEVSRGALRTLLNKVVRWFRRREEVRKWKAMLFSKEVDEQLWAVRPPRSSVSDPSVREWARQTLDDAGYDSRAMLREWEIFWRRKAL